jgi:hypothetical protein
MVLSMKKWVRQRRAALLDMARDLEPNESIDCVEKFEDLKILLRQLCALGHPPAEMIRRINHSALANELLGFLARQYRGTPRWQPFVDAVLTCTEDWFLDLIDPKTVGFIFQKGETIDYIVKHHLPVVRQRHAFTAALWWDSYWTHVVRRCLDHGRVDLAYRELCRARSGIFFGQPEERLSRTDLMRDPRYRLYPASRARYRLLVSQTYAAVVTTGLVPEDPLPTLWEADEHRPGWWGAQPFMLAHHREGTRLLELYEPEGSMVLMLAAVLGRQALKTAELVPA